MKRNGQTQLNFDILPSTETLSIAVIAPFKKSNLRYERAENQVELAKLRLSGEGVTHTNCLSEGAAKNPFILRIFYIHV